MGEQSGASRADRERDVGQFAIRIRRGPYEGRAMAKNGMFDDLAGVSHGSKYSSPDGPPRKDGFADGGVNRPWAAHRSTAASGRREVRPFRAQQGGAGSPGRRARRRARDRGRPFTPG